MRKWTLLLVLTALFSGMAAAKEPLAVLPFTGGTGGDGETIAELFSYTPELNEVFVPIPRTSITRAIGNEQSFQASTGMTDPDTIAAIGRQVGAKYVVAGNITKLGNRNLLVISILKIDDLRQIAGDMRTYTEIEEIQDELSAMARNITRAAKSTTDRLAKLSVVPVEMGGNVDSQVADTLAQILSIFIIRSGKYSVYPRTATLEQVQREYDTQLSGVTADESLVDMGRGDNPRLVLAVAARKLGAQNMFNASIINLESGVQESGDSVNYTSLNNGIQVMENLARALTGVSGTLMPAGEMDILSNEAYKETIKETARRTPSGSGVTNKRSPSFGGAVLGYGALNMALGLGSFIQRDWGGALALLGGYGVAAGLIVWEFSLDYYDPMVGIPGGIGLGVAGVAAIYGFIRPALYARSRALTGIMDNINVSATAGSRGGQRIGLSYTVKF
jgi:TolB-like protein